MTTITAEKLKSFCDEKEIKIDVHNRLLTLLKKFEKGSKEGYEKAKNDISIIHDVPCVGDDSVYGTTGETVVNLGYMRLNKSNVSKRFLSKLKKLL